MAEFMKWHIVDSAAFDAGVKKPTDLYFLSDTFEIYRGANLFTQAVGVYETGKKPTRPAQNRLYFDRGTLEGSYFDGTNWNTVVKPLTDTVTDDGVNPVTGTAVAAYVAAKIEEGATSANCVTSVTYDSTTHKLTIAKGKDGADTSDITLSGLAVGLKFTSGASKNSLQLVDAAGTLIGDAIELDKERFVTGSDYNTETKTITLYFDGKTGAESTDKIEVPVGDLVDTYTVESTSTVTLTEVANKITAAVKISAEANNALVAKDDGLYVPTVDTSDLMSKVPGATAGNIPVLDEHGNLVDSGKSIEDAGKATLYTGESIDAAVGEATPKDGDFCIVKKLISGDKYEHTAYIYKNSAWAAMDGNYNADNVYFANDLVTTSAIGNVTLTNGQATIAAAGQNLTTVWNKIFVKEKNPTVTQPSVSLSAPQNKSYPVGTKVTPSYSASLNAGSYEFGPATGITAKSWAISNTDGGSATTATGTFEEITVGDATNYKITATATYEAGAVPKSNVGNEVAASQIKAGTKSATSTAITGYRPCFYGSLESKTGEVNSALIRTLTATTSAVRAGSTFNIAVHKGHFRVIIAYPQSVQDPSKVLDSNASDANIAAAFIATKVNVNVEGANGYEAVPYNVYCVDSGVALDANTYKVTI